MSRHNPENTGAFQPHGAGAIARLTGGVVLWWSQVFLSCPDPQVGLVVDRRARCLGTLLLIALAGLLLLPNLSYPLIDPDESRYAEISREMLDSGDLIVPTRLGKPYLDKPPLFYWLTAGSFRLFGVSEASARLIPALAALGTVLCALLLGSRFVGYAAAWLGSLAILSCFGFLISARFVFIDTLLTLFTTVGLLAGHLAARSTALNRGWWAISAIACGLGVLAKGPVAAALCLPPIAFNRWLTGSRAIRARDWAVYGAIAGVVSVPWFLLVNIRQPGFLAEFFWTHHVSRFVSGLSHAEPWWYYAPVLFVGMLPCSILFPAVAAFLLDRGGTVRPWRTWDIGFFALAAGWTVLLFTLSSGKLPPYVLPAVPLICLIVGRGLEAILSGRVDNRFLRYVRHRSPQHLVLILLGAALVCGSFDMWNLDGAASGRLPRWLALVGCCTLAAFVLRLGIFSRKIAPWSVLAFVVACEMGMGVVDFYPRLAGLRSKVDPVLNMCQGQIERSVPIVCLSLTSEADSFAFHVAERRVHSFEAGEVDDVVNVLCAESEAIVLVKTTSVDELRSRLHTTLTLNEIGRYEHIFVGTCTKAPARGSEPNGSHSLSPYPFGND